MSNVKLVFDEVLRAAPVTERDRVRAIVESISDLPAEALLGLRWVGAQSWELVRLKGPGPTILARTLSDLSDAGLNVIANRGLVMSFSKGGTRADEVIETWQVPAGEAPKSPPGRKRGDRRKRRRSKEPAR